MSNKILFIASTFKNKFNKSIIFPDYSYKFYMDKYSVISDNFFSNPDQNNFKKRDQNYVLIKELETKIFHHFIEVLNEYHKTNHQVKFWSIILRKWFRRILQVALNRYKNIELITKHFRIDSIINDEYCVQLASNTSRDAVINFNDKAWNASFYDLLLRHMGFDTILINPKRKTIPQIFVKEQIKTKYSTFIKFYLNKASNLIQGHNKPYLQKTYFSRYNEWKMSMKTSLNPLLRFNLKYKTKELPNLKDRDKLIKNLSAKLIKSKNWDHLTEFVVLSTIYTLPICYLEDFKNLVSSTKKLCYPQNPRYIFTSNAYDFDEYFKVFSASKCTKNTNLVIGQHGNNYGVRRYDNPTVEEEIADIFLTWGWKGKLNSHKPYGVIKYSSIIQRTFSNNLDKILLISPRRPFMFRTWDVFHEYIECLENLSKMSLLLKPNIQNRLLLRLPPGKKNEFNYEKKIYKSNINIPICSNKPIFKYINQSSIIIHGYDSTGVLETMSKNIPTLVYVRNGIKNISNEALDIYKRIYGIGLFFDDFKKLAEKLNIVCNDIDGWWSSSEIQNTVKIFRDKFAKTPEERAEDFIKKKLDGKI